jgi:Zn-dependent alcohol dehydrogenase
VRSCALEYLRHSALYICIAPAACPVDQLLSERIALDDINGAFDRLADGKTVRQVVRF